MREYVRRFTRLALGLTALAVGISMTFQAALGLSPWDVLHDGLSRLLGITPGEASIAVGALVLLLDILFKERLGFGTLINVLAVGKIFDLIQYLGVIPDFSACEGLEQLAPRLALCIGSMVVQSVGMYLYMSAELGGGPRDSLICALARRTGKLGVGGTRLAIEAVVFGIGWFLGGRIGLGSIILVAATGPVMAAVFRMLKFDIKALEHKTIAQTVRDFKGSTQKTAS